MNDLVPAPDFSSMCLYITITILLWVLSIYPFIKHYTVVVSIITIQFSHIYAMYLFEMTTIELEAVAVQD